MRLQILIFILMILVVNCVAFGFDPFNIFGDHEDNEGEDEGSENSPPREKDQSDNTRGEPSCSEYLCRPTMACVKKPLDCPCPRSIDVKCPVGDWYICLRDDQRCEDWKDLTLNTAFSHFSR